MLVKTVDKGGCDGDRHLPPVLFAYQLSQQQSTEESLFLLVCGTVEIRDSRWEQY